MTTSAVSPGVVELPHAASSGAVSNATVRGAATRGSEQNRLAFIGAIKASTATSAKRFSAGNRCPPRDLDVVKPAHFSAGARTYNRGRSAELGRRFIAPCGMIDLHATG